MGGGRQKMFQKVDHTFWTMGVTSYDNGYVTTQRDLTKAVIDLRNMALIYYQFLIKFFINK